MKAAFSGSFVLILLSLSMASQIIEMDVQIVSK